LWNRICLASAETRFQHWQRTTSQSKAHKHTTQTELQLNVHHQGWQHKLDKRTESSLTTQADFLNVHQSGFGEKHCLVNVQVSKKRNVEYYCRFTAQHLDTRTKAKMQILP
jgi:hypothetical protein